MSSVYQGQLAQALRGAYLTPAGQLVIQDEFRALDQPTTVRWAMVTPAQVTFTGDKTALLKQKGKTLRVRVLTDTKTQLQTYSTKPKADYDAANPGTRMLGFEVSLAPNQRMQMAVVLSSQSSGAGESIDLQPVLQWSEPK